MVNRGKDVGVERMNERRIIARKATPPFGLSLTYSHLADFGRNVAFLRRMTLALWARRSDTESVKLIHRRVTRTLGKWPIEGRRSEVRDPLCDPLDVVLTVAGILWPGLDLWDRMRARDEVLADVWWSRWGELPGAAILRDGVLHLVYLDRDADRMGKCEWAQWADNNWTGLILHHGIQWTGEEGVDDSVLVARLRRQTLRGGCLLWTTRDGSELQPWRVDFAGAEILLRSMSGVIQIAAAPGSPLSLRTQMARLGDFWTWLRHMEVPQGMRGLVPGFIRLNSPLSLKVKGVKKASKKRQENQGATQARLNEVLIAPEVPETVAEREFGIKFNANLAPERIQQMVKTASSELRRALVSQNRPKSERWRGILQEVEALTPPRATVDDIGPPPPGT